MLKIMEEPNERQKLFFESEARFTAYGGARGGGKSWAVRQKAILLAVGYGGIRILLLRRSYPELRENHILPMMAQLTGVAVYKESEKAFCFANGSRIRFGYCDGEQDVMRYQGQEYDVIFLDEATQFTEFQFRTLTASLRGANPFPKRFYLTCNPGGVGHAWVKRLFLDRQYRSGERAEDYVFIPARVTDNRAILAHDPGYVQMLESLPDELRRAWLDGNWDVFAGQYFSEFDRAVHVCKPFPIPEGWRRYFAMDYGLDMLAGYWAAFSPQGHAYVYREVYESGLIVSEAASRILSEGEPVYSHLAPSDLWGRSADTGISQAERFAVCGLDLTQVVAASRVAGWMELHEWLRVREENGKKTARLHIFDNCPNLIRTLPLLQHDLHRPDDCANSPHEITHAPDALRYLLAGRPACAEPVRTQRSILPFALQTQEQDEGGFLTW
jgi:phage terminase large subunit